MKKNHLISSLLIASCLLLSGCTAPTPSSTTPPQKEEDPKPIRTTLYGAFESKSFYEENEKEYSANFDTVEYTDNTAPQTRQIELFGQNYNLIYLQSRHIGMTDLSVHEYMIDGNELASVEFDTATDKLIAYFHIPFSGTMTTEEQYTDYIAELLGGQYNLDDYDLQRTTHYYAYFTEPYDVMKSQEVDGFRILADNEELGSYNFYYTKLIDGHPTTDTIYVSFGRGTLSVSIYDLGYEKADFADLLNSQDRIQSDIDTFLRTGVKQEYTVHDIKTNSTRLFIHEGIPYLLTTSRITYTTKNSSEQQTIFKQTITGRQ